MQLIDIEHRPIKRVGGKCTIIVSFFFDKNKGTTLTRNEQLLRVSSSKKGQLRFVNNK